MSAIEPSRLPFWLALLLTTLEFIPVMILSVAMTVALVSDGRKNGFTVGSWRVIAFMVTVFIGCLLLLKCIWL